MQIAYCYLCAHFKRFSEDLKLGLKIICLWSGGRYFWCRENCCEHIWTFKCSLWSSKWFFYEIIHQSSINFPNIVTSTLLMWQHCWCDNIVDVTTLLMWQHCWCDNIADVIEYLTSVSFSTKWNKNKYREWNSS